MKMKKQSPVFEPWCSYPENHEMYDQQTQPLPIIRLALDSPATTQETSQQRFRRLKAISDATGTRLLFVYLRDQGRTTVADRRMMQGNAR
ncbi:MAG: hypothetical protein JO202_17555 [Ktedonobacteraceae bacterium]|nr:hypothetical protein [Ktedonobacteraceae bacterium]